MLGQNLAKPMYSLAQTRAPSAMPAGHGHSHGGLPPASQGEGASGPAPSHARAMALAANFASRQDVASPTPGQPPYAPFTGAARAVLPRGSGSGGLTTTSDTTSGQLGTLSGGAHNGGARAAESFCLLRLDPRCSQDRACMMANLSRITSWYAGPVVCSLDAVHTTLGCAV